MNQKTFQKNQTMPTEEVVQFQQFRIEALTKEVERLKRILLEEKKPLHQKEPRWEMN